MIYSALKRRGFDSYGSGDYGAPRGKRLHRGIDFVCEPAEIITSPVDGFVSKFGYPYGNHPEYRYVEITDQDGFRHRIFYIDFRPYFFDEAGGQIVKRLDPIGEAQDLTRIYPGITNHVHYEIINPDGKYINPETGDE